MNKRIKSYKKQLLLSALFLPMPFAGTGAYATPLWTTENLAEVVQPGASVTDIVVRGQGLNAVNALSFALPYDATAYEFVGVEAEAAKDMHNMTYDRLHTNGVKALYPTFVNIGDREVLKGDAVLFTIRMKAKKNVKFGLKAQDGLLVNKAMEYIKF